MMAFSSGRAVPTMSVKKSLELKVAGEHTKRSKNHPVFGPKLGLSRTSFCINFPLTGTRRAEGWNGAPRKQPDKPRTSNTDRDSRPRYRHKFNVGNTKGSRNTVIKCHVQTLVGQWIYQGLVVSLQGVNTALRMPKKISVF